MSAPTQNITLDMGRRIESRKVVYLGQGDSNGTMLMVSLTDGGRPYDVSGMTVTLTISVCGETFAFDGTANGNMAQFQIDESVLGDVSGRFRGAYVTISDETFTTSSQRFDVEVLPSFKPSESSDEPSDEPSDHTCGCTEGSLTDDDIEEIWEG